MKEYKNISIPLLVILTSLFGGCVQNQKEVSSFDTQPNINSRWRGPDRYRDVIRTIIIQSTLYSTNLVRHHNRARR
jgi:hypothetical protein